MLCFHALLLLQRPLHHPDARRVISWEIRRQHGGTPSLMETTAEASAPLFGQTELAFQLRL